MELELWKKLQLDNLLKSFDKLIDFLAVRCAGWPKKKNWPPTAGELIYHVSMYFHCVICIFINGDSGYWVYVPTVTLWPWVLALSTFRYMTCAAVVSTHVQYTCRKTCTEFRYIYIFYGI